MEGLENELWCRWSEGKVGEWALLIPSLHLRRSSFSNPSAALLTSQLILQPFCCFTYVIGTSPTSQLILQPFHRFTYDTAHSPTLPLLYLCHSSFSNPSFASPTSQVLHLIHLASRPWKEPLWRARIPGIYSIPSIVHNVDSSKKFVTFPLVPVQQGLCECIAVPLFLLGNFMEYPKSCKFAVTKNIVQNVEHSFVTYPDFRC